MDWITDPNVWLGLLTLTILEIVLGVDNIIFISILSSKLPPDKQAKARSIGLAGAFCTRVLLLLSIAWLSKLTTPLFTVAELDISGRSLILIFGGLFLIGKATFEIHGKLEGGDEHSAPKPMQSLVGVVAQIAIIDIVFSLDSVITAVGMTDRVAIMIAANVLALGFMLLASGPVSRFVDGHPTIKMLALAFLVLIGTNLVAEGLGQHIPKGYTYFAMAFSVFVEMLNLRLRPRVDPAVRLRGQRTPGSRAETPGPRAEA
jgi:predicted tellurium resistance membrane protein TerC